MGHHPKDCIDRWERARAEIGRVHLACRTGKETDGRKQVLRSGHKDRQDRRRHEDGVGRMLGLDHLEQ